MLVEKLNLYPRNPTLSDGKKRNQHVFRWKTNNFAGTLPFGANKILYIIHIFRIFWGREARLDFGDMTRLGSEVLSSTIGWKPGLPWRNTGLHQKNTSFLALPVDGSLEKKNRQRRGHSGTIISYIYFRFSLTRLVKDDKTGFTWKALDHYRQRSFGTKSWVPAMVRSKFN